MAHFIIAGRADDPVFAKIERLADRLESNLPDFHVTRKPQLPKLWAEFVQSTAKQNGWTADQLDNAHGDLKRTSANSIFRRQVESNGNSIPDQLVWRHSGALVGDASRFLSLIEHSYAVDLLPEEIDPVLLLDIAKENMQALQN